MNDQYIYEQYKDEILIAQTLENQAEQKKKFQQLLQQLEQDTNITDLIKKKRIRSLTQKFNKNDKILLKQINQLNNQIKDGILTIKKTLDDDEIRKILKQFLNEKKIVTELNLTFDENIQIFEFVEFEKLLPDIRIFKSKSLIFDNFIAKFSSLQKIIMDQCVVNGKFSFICPDLQLLVLNICEIRQKDEILNSINKSPSLKNILGFKLLGLGSIEGQDLQKSMILPSFNSFVTNRFVKSNIQMAKQLPQKKKKKKSQKKK